MKLPMNSWKLCGRVATWVASAGLLIGPSGCSRTFWRDQADRDSYLATTEKLTDPRWAVPRIDLNPDPNSRFYDPYDPDAEPLPPDDSAAHVYMHWADGWEGYKGWHKFGQVMTVENPTWLANFGISQESVDPVTGEIVGPVPAINDATLTQTVELAQLHNRDYQTQIENVYLAALAVTFQRFQFGVRYLTAGGQEPGVNVNNTFIPHGPGDTTNMNIGGGVSQLLPAGTQWAVEFANNTIWLFGGGSETRSMSTLSFSIVQPLLFGAGRKVGLEGLTQSERNLLYTARDLARFRQQLFVNVVAGGSGYLTLLSQLQAIRNARGNIARQEEQVQRLLAQSARNTRFAGVDLAAWPADVPNPPPQLQGRLQYREEIDRMLWRSVEPISDQEIEILRGLSQDEQYQQAVTALVQILRTEVATLDVLQLASNLARSTNQLRQQETNFQDNLDNYKLLLGLPPDMQFSIDDSLLQPFQVIDPRLSELEERGKDLVLEWAPIPFEDPAIGDLRTVLVGLRAYLADVVNVGMAAVAEDMEKVRTILPERVAQQRTPEAAVRLQSDFDRAVGLLQSAQGDAQRMEGEFLILGQNLSGDVRTAEDRQKDFESIGVLREEIVQLTQNLQVIQSSFRVELIEVQPFNMSLQRVTQLALENRVDLMNARAVVMDARRQVEIAANALQSTLDLVVEGDVNTPTGTKPFDFRGEDSRLRVGLGFDAPLDQINERNAYRQALIAYQRQRRAYMLFEDQVKQDVRQSWRQLLLLSQNLETNRQAVRLAALQYDSAVQDSRAPVRISSGGTGGGGGGGGGGGVQGNNLINALNSLLNAQDSLVQTWTSYERNRLNIYFDMGIMEIGEDGVWNDPIYRSSTNGEQHEQVPSPIGPLDGVDSGYSDPDFDRWSRLGVGNAELELVEVPGGGNGGGSPEEPRDRQSGQGALPRLPVGAGQPRQPE